MTNVEKDFEEPEESCKLRAGNNDQQLPGPERLPGSKEPGTKANFWWMVEEKVEEKGGKNVEEGGGEDGGEEGEETWTPFLPGFILMLLSI